MAKRPSKARRPGPSAAGIAVEPPRVETPEEALAREQARGARRLADLRAVIRRAQEIRRESDLYHLAHIRRWHHSPRRWTAEQVDEARKFIESFVSPDGIPQADPIRRKGRWRL